MDVMAEARTRTCVGCGSHDDPKAMVRLVVSDGEIVVDLDGGVAGRGAHLHPRRECIEKAARGGLARSMKADVDGSRLAPALAGACEKRMTELWKRQARVAAEMNKLRAAIDAARETQAGAPCSRRPEAR